MIMVAVMAVAAEVEVGTVSHTCTICDKTYPTQRCLKSTSKAALIKHCCAM